MLKEKRFKAITEFDSIIRFIGILIIGSIFCAIDCEMSTDVPLIRVLQAIDWMSPRSHPIVVGSDVRSLISQFREQLKVLNLKLDLSVR